MLVAGGRIQSCDSQTGAEVYDPQTGKWKPVAPMNNARFKHTATLLPDGKVLVVGGMQSGDIAASSTEVYDPLANTWTVVDALSTARSHHTATLLPTGKVLVAGGYNGSILDSAELYDPAADTWTTVAPLNTGRYFDTAVLLPNGIVLVTGGTSGNYTGAEQASAEIYDPALNTWTTIAPMNSVHFIHTATLLMNGRVLVTGGWNGYNPLDSAEVLDTGLGFDEAWRPAISSMPASLLSGTALSLTGTGFRGYQFAEGTGGGVYTSPSGYPLVQIRRLDSEQWLWLTPASFSSTSYTSLPVTGFPKGPVLVTVFVNGIPSQSKLLMLRDYFYVYLPLVRK